MAGTEPSKDVVIAVDAMGGDHAPQVVVEGCEQALAADSRLTVLLAGPNEVVTPFCERHERARALIAPEVIAMGEHPAEAVRRKRSSSIVLGCKAVKGGEAEGFFSAGSTGACLAAATLYTGRVKGVQRPAIATILPGYQSRTVLTDAGANADCKPECVVWLRKSLSRALNIAEFGDKKLSQRVRELIRSFQQTRDLPADGKIDLMTILLLNASGGANMPHLTEAQNGL